MKGEYEMTIAEMMEKMIVLCDGSLHDINHMIGVWTYARTIGQLEKLDQETQYILEAAAITHDIACPFIWDEFGHTNHKRQETEGAVMVRDFLASLPEDQLERIAYLVGHHHTLNNIDGADYQILVEADLIMNACEKGWKLDRIFPILRTDAGKRIASAVLPAD